MITDTQIINNTNKNMKLKRKHSPTNYQNLKIP